MQINDIMEKFTSEFNSFLQNNPLKTYISINKNQSYYAIKAKNLLAASVTPKKDELLQIEIGSKYANGWGGTVSEVKGGKYVRFHVSDENLSDAVTFIADLAMSMLSGESFDCCSRYMECSDEKTCINPYPELRLMCNYRKIMESGRVFYGKNRNI